MLRGPSPNSPNCGHAVLAAQFPCAASLSGRAACRSMAHSCALRKHHHLPTASDASHVEATLALGTTALCESLCGPNPWGVAKWSTPWATMPKHAPEQVCLLDLPRLSSGPGYASLARPCGPKVRSCSDYGSLADVSWDDGRRLDIDIVVYGATAHGGGFAAMQPWCHPLRLAWTGHPQPCTVEVSSAAKSPRIPSLRGPQGWCGAPSRDPAA